MPSEKLHDGGSPCRTRGWAKKRNYGFSRSGPNSEMQRHPEYPAGGRWPHGVIVGNGGQRSGNWSGRALDSLKKQHRFRPIRRREAKSHSALRPGQNASLGTFQVAIFIGHRANQTTRGPCVSCRSGRAPMMAKQECDQLGTMVLLFPVGECITPAHK